MEALVRVFEPITTYIAIFDYHITPEGRLSTLNDEFVIRTLRKHHIVPLATITNLTAAGFSPGHVTEVLREEGRRNRLIENIYRLLGSKNYGGAVIDFERVRAGDRNAFTAFMSALSRRLRAGGYTTAVAVPPKTSEDIPWMRGYDFAGIGGAADLVFIMAYDWHEVSTPPGPVAPIGEVRKSLEFAIARMDRSKILLGLARYGYDWVVPGAGPRDNRAVSVQTAIQTASRYEVPIAYSLQDEQAYFAYTDQQGRQHVVWFEDIKGRAAKYNLAVELRIRGGGSWHLGLEFPQSRYLVHSFIRARKRI
jgi:spore germination protein YaaH